jgi:hypothetical protein
VDSSPVDHRTRKSDPVTPVTTPSRGASPTFLEEICTRSPTTAMHLMVPRRGASGQRFSTPFAHNGRLEGRQGGRPPSGEHNDRAGAPERTPIG